MPLGISVVFRFDEGNLRTARGLFLQPIETKNQLMISSWLASLGNKFIFANVNPTTITKKLPKEVIVADLVVTAKITPRGEGAKVVEVRKETEDIVYTFSSEEVIPLIYNRLTK